MLLVNARSQPSPIHRLGLFAEETIPVGAIVSEFRSGFDLTLTEHEVACLSTSARSQVLRHAFYESSSRCYLLDSDDGRFTNHSDDPNTRQVGMASFATRKIGAGEEITLDYLALDGDAPVPLQSVSDQSSVRVVEIAAGLEVRHTDDAWELITSVPMKAGQRVVAFSGPVPPHVQSVYSKGDRKQAT